MEYEVMFGYRLKMLVDDPEEIENLMTKVYKLIAHIVNIDYNVFRPGNLENWQATLQHFHTQLLKCEQEAKEILDNCINSLRYVLIQIPHIICCVAANYMHNVKHPTHLGAQNKVWLS